VTARLCEGRVVIVTGAGRGIGRAHALALAQAGARVVVNDLGVALDGRGGAEGPAAEVVAEVRAAGGEAVADTHDVADEEGARALIRTALDTYGDLHALVNNAGFVRDRMFVSATFEEWDAVMRVHLRGHFAPSRCAVDHWRAQQKAGKPVDARIVNTTSGAGLLGSIGQAAYSTAKAGLVGLTLVQAAELGRYGITANAIAPAARTRMTEAVFAQAMAKPESGFDPMDPANIAPLVVYLASEASRAITGRVFELSGGRLSLAQGWREGPVADKGETWAADELVQIVPDLVMRGVPPIKVYGT
jgi:NAD(P)-dependent dehydrogenase (short-subunit alcohol dehydrogenase family)